MTSNVLDLCYDAYKKGGMNAAIEIGEKHKLPYKYCEPCETDTPHSEEVCCVCWSANKRGGE